MNRDHVETEPARSAFPVPVCAARARCKCRGAESPLFGVVDFHKSCESVRGKEFALSGVPVYYHRCARCGLLFSTSLDGLSAEELLAFVYNEDYGLVDPDFAEVRPRRIANFLSRLFQKERPRRVLDYGCGNGSLAELLRRKGFPEVCNYDPLRPELAARPGGRFDCVVSFEVVEHSPQPLATLADMSGFLEDEGLLLFSTMLQPSDIERQGVNWWYVAPRNGHVSLFSRKAMRAVARRLRMSLGHFDDALHAMFRSLPGFARDLLPPDLAKAPEET